MQPLSALWAIWPGSHPRLWLLPYEVWLLLSPGSKRTELRWGSTHHAKLTLKNIFIRLSTLPMKYLKKDIMVQSFAVDLINAFKQNVSSIWRRMDSDLDNQTSLFVHEQIVSIFSLLIACIFSQEGKNIIPCMICRGIYSWLLIDIGLLVLAGDMTLDYGSNRYEDISNQGETIAYWFILIQRQIPFCRLLRISATSN